jgi:hypothetical protein
MKKFQVWETNSGCDIGDEFEAQDRETALEETLAQQDYAVREVKDKSRVVISIKDGLIQNIDIPEDLDVVVETRDYDIDSLDKTCKDAEGNLYRLGEWE